MWGLRRQFGMAQSMIFMALQGQSSCSCFSPTPWSQWSHPGVIGSVFICVENRSRERGSTAGTLAFFSRPLD